MEKFSNNPQFTSEGIIDDSNGKTSNRRIRYQGGCSSHRIIKGQCYQQIQFGVKLNQGLNRL
jgi:hypothetical protein